MKSSPQGFFYPTWGKIILTIIYSVIIFFVVTLMLSFFDFGLTDLCLPNLGSTDEGNPIDFTLSDNLNIGYVLQNIFRGYCPSVSIPFTIYAIRFVLLLIAILFAYTLACLTVLPFRKQKK